MAGLDLSVVVIARDEERTIGACLDAIFVGLGERAFEAILVDSASTDRTREIAAQYPVWIVPLGTDEPRRPSVARHVGFGESRGRLVLFVDGDAVLDPDWIEPALAALEHDPGLAGIAGASEAVLEQGGALVVRDQYPDADYDAPTHLSGSALYRRSALERAGDFNPSMYGAEEIELGARLRRAGYRLRRLRQRMTRHHPRAEKESVSELVRRTRRRYPVGMGQLARHVISHRLPAPGAVQAIGRHLAFLAFLVLGVASGAVAIAHGATPLLVWLATAAGLAALFVLRAGGVRRPAYYVLEWTLTSPLVVWGLLARPRGAPGTDDAGVGRVG
jgi:glycosyltransferase involved in cell wall biosynthesis